MVSATKLWSGTTKSPTTTAATKMAQPRRPMMPMATRKSGRSTAGGVMSAV